MEVDGPRLGIGGRVNEPDGIARAQTDPLRDGTILLLGFGQLLLRAEGFVGL